MATLTPRADAARADGLPCYCTTYTTSGALGMGLRVTVAEGDVDGFLGVTVKGRSYGRFIGLPYATARRFCKPKTPPGWKGVRKANLKVVCAQNEFLTGRGMRGVEDGLVANVYSPVEALSVPAKLPVMVFIHGGAFTQGDGNPDVIGPGWLLDYGVILVTINYRLGPLGFLTTGNDAIPANLVTLILLS